MKKVNFLCLVVIIAAFLTSCMCDPYSDKRPFDYGDAKWICEETYIYFTVDLTEEEYYYPKGEIEINGAIYPCEFSFIHQTNVLHILVYNTEDFSPENMLARIDGECDFSPDTLVFHIDKDRDEVFNGKYDTLTFSRN